MFFNRKLDDKCIRYASRKYRLYLKNKILSNYRKQYAYQQRLKKPEYHKDIEYADRLVGEILELEDELIELTSQ